jgi:Cdc6-like AAA superfamily ATPase
MAIRDHTEDEFQKVLYAHLSPSEPISSVQLLKGRTKTLQQIRQALLSPGRNIFIFGDRGVGKTSLAQTELDPRAVQFSGLVRVGRV